MHNGGSSGQRTGAGASSFVSDEVFSCSGKTLCKVPDVCFGCRSRPSQELAVVACMSTAVAESLGLPFDVMLGNADDNDLKEEAESVRWLDGLIALV